MNLTTKKTILVAPLNWGLGHATRCIPIIRGLLKHGYHVLIGSDGAALQLLKQEFPELPDIELPSYHISYPEDGKLFKKSMLKKLPQLFQAAKKERKIVRNLVNENRIHGIISDNRLGVRNKNVISVYLTHQLNVLSGSTTLWSSKMHQEYIKKFDQCWVPDYEDSPNLSGKLGHLEKKDNAVIFIGPLSRMQFKKEVIVNDILILLSGPEPQRTLLEDILTKQLLNTEKKVLLVKGVVEEVQKWTQNSTIKIVNFLTSFELEKAINASEIVISRSGYTSIMDLVALNKKVFFIPTPGQFEQEYLAERLHLQKSIPSCSQDDFSEEKLTMIDDFTGWEIYKNHHQDFAKLFSIF